MERKLVLFFAVFAQAVTSAPPEKIDLTIAQTCEPQTSNDDEIVVCGRRGNGFSPYRINQPTPRQSEAPTAEFQLA